MRFACWMVNATDTHSEYIILTTYCFSTATIVTLARLNFQFICTFLSCCIKVSSMSCSVQSTIHVSINYVSSLYLLLSIVLLARVHLLVFFVSTIIRKRSVDVLLNSDTKSKKMSSRFMHINISAFRNVMPCNVMKTPTLQQKQSNPHAAGNKFLSNVYKYVPDSTASHSRAQLRLSYIAVMRTCNLIQMCNAEH